MSNYPPSRRDGKYFQIPLCAFVFGSSDRERIETIISYSIIETGANQWKKLTESERHAFLEASVGNRPRRFNRHDSRHLAAVCGADKTGMCLGSLDNMLKQHAALKIFRTSFERQHGVDPLVRLKAELVFEARDGTGITPRELAVLAAIFSVVGDKQGPVLITQDRIRRRALGYKTRVVCDAEFPKRSDGATPLSDWKLRSTIERLHTRKFFARATYGRRLTYYSHRLSNSQLRKAVIERKTFSFFSKRLAQLDDAAMTDAIRNQRAALAGQPPPAPDAQPLKQPGGITPEDVF